MPPVWARTRVVRAWDDGATVAKHAVGAIVREAVLLDHVMHKVDVVLPQDAP